MSIISLIVVLIVIGLCLYLLQFLPIDANIKQIIYAIVIVCVIIWLLMNFLPANSILTRPIGVRP